MADYFVNDATDAAWTWLLGFLGFNSGPDDLGHIRQQLDRVLGALQTLSSQLDTARYEQAAAAINTEAIVPLTSLTNRLLELSRTHIPTDEPFLPSQDVERLRTDLAEFQISKALGVMQNYLPGTHGQSNILALASTRQASRLGVEQQVRFMNMPLRSNKILEELTAIYEFYEGYQILACNLLAEASHSSTNPVGDIRIASTQIEEAAALGVPLRVNSLEVEGGRLSSVVSYRVFTGGTFQCGSVPASQSFQLERHSHRVLASGSVASLAYRSSDRSVLGISNLPGHEGELIWHTQESAQHEIEVGASVLGDSSESFPVEIQQSVSYSLVSEPRTLEGIVVFPRNRLYLDPSVREQYRAVGFYSDNTVSDLSRDVTWVVRNPQGFDVEGARFASSTPGALILENPKEGYLEISVRWKHDSEVGDRFPIRVAD